MAAAIAPQTNGITTSSDWHNRYYHVDQILDRPGPRTDESFMAGEGVRVDPSSYDEILRSVHLLGQEFSAKSV
jgi:hypothetical protein